MAPEDKRFDPVLAEEVMSSFGRFLETDPDGIAWLEGIRSGFLSDAINGNPIAARRVLWGAARDLREGKVLAPSLIAFLASALEAAVANPKAAGRALGLVAGRGAPTKHDPLRDWQVALHVQRLRDSGMLRGNDAGDDGSAIAQAALDFHTSARTIRRHLESHSRLWRELDEAFDSAIRETQANNSSE